MSRVSCETRLLCALRDTGANLISASGQIFASGSRDDFGTAFAVRKAREAVDHAAAALAAYDEATSPPAVPAASSNAAAETESVERAAQAIYGVDEDINDEVAEALPGLKAIYEATGLIGRQPFDTLQEDIREDYRRRARAALGLGASTDGPECWLCGHKHQASQPCVQPNTSENADRGDP